jgi:hypothetical protein
MLSAHLGSRFNLTHWMERTGMFALIMKNLTRKGKLFTADYENPGDNIFLRANYFMGQFKQYFAQRAARNNLGVKKVEAPSKYPEK